jgi:hypothetical protein
VLEALAGFVTYRLRQGVVGGFSLVSHAQEPNRKRRAACGPSQSTGSNK